MLQSLAHSRRDRRRSLPLPYQAHLLAQKSAQLVLESLANRPLQRGQQPGSRRWHRLSRGWALRWYQAPLLAQESAQL